MEDDLNERWAEYKMNYTAENQPNILYSISEDRNSNGIIAKSLSSSAIIVS